MTPLSKIVSVSDIRDLVNKLRCASSPRVAVGPGSTSKEIQMARNLEVEACLFEAAMILNRLVGDAFSENETVPAKSAQVFDRILAKITRDVQADSPWRLPVVPTDHQRTPDAECADSRRDSKTTARPRGWGESTDEAT